MVLLTIELLFNFTSKTAPEMQISTSSVNRNFPPIIAISNTGSSIELPIMELALFEEI